MKISRYVMPALLLVVACTQDNYDKGEGRYSLMRAEFAEAHVNAARQVDYIVTDDDVRLPLASTVSASNVPTADSLYRCMLYYNKVETDGQQRADVLNMTFVPCPSPKLASAMEVITDPVKFESLWRSKNGRYVNMGLQLLTGTTDDTTAIHQLAVVADTLIQHPDSTRSLHLRLHHNQNGMPEYYSTKVYLSLPADRLPADTIHFSINTYQGLIEKTLPLR